VNDQEIWPHSGTLQPKEQVFAPSLDGGKATACEPSRIESAGLR
jgi:hypothetical protein